ncbi:unnamed protein product, partial [Prorocentrum cordatum]
MGWAHALALRQQIHESALEEEGGLDPRLRVADGRALPPLSEGLHAAYVDNFLGFGDSAAQADAQLRAAQRGLAAVEREQLGWRFDGAGGVLRPKMARLWRLRLGALELSLVGFASGRQVERIVGHFTFAGLARRLRCCDASEEGRGAVERDFDWEKVAEVGRRQERWRHRQLEGGTPARPREVLEEVVGEKVGSERFEDAPIDMARGGWRVASSGGWERSESIATLEGR